MGAPAVQGVLLNTAQIFGSAFSLSIKRQVRRTIKPHSRTAADLYINEQSMFDALLSNNIIISAWAKPEGLTAIWRASMSPQDREYNPANSILTVGNLLSDRGLDTETSTFPLILYLLGEVTIIRYHHLGGLELRSLLFQCFGDWGSKIKVPAGTCSLWPVLVRVLLFCLCLLGNLELSGKREPRLRKCFYQPGW